MPNLFGLDIAGIVATSLQQAGGLVAATLTKWTAGAYDVNNPASGTQKTSAQYGCQVAATKYVLSTEPDDLTRTTKGKIVVILRSVAGGVVPGVGDWITLVPPGSTAQKTFVITGDIDVDGAGAAAECSVEGNP